MQHARFKPHMVERTFCCSDAPPAPPGARSWAGCQMCQLGRFALEQPCRAQKCSYGSACTTRGQAKSCVKSRKHVCVGAPPSVIGDSTARLDRSAQTE